MDAVKRDECWSGEAFEAIKRHYIFFNTKGSLVTQLFGYIAKGTSPAECWEESIRVIEELKKFVNVQVNRKEFQVDGASTGEWQETWREQIQRENDDQNNAARVTIHTLGSEPVAFT